jgi:NADPH2:quinone reductase
MNTKAARLVDHGSPLEIEELSLPEPGAGEVVVDMLYSGLNPVDHYNAIGRINEDIPLPRTLGMEGVGRLGDRIVLVHGHGVATALDGLWSQRAVVPTAACIDVPAGISPQAAATMGVAGVTAWRTVTELADVTENDAVLVLGASGGVGSIIVSVAHALGATVWGQTGRQSHEKWIRELGADEVVVCDADELGRALKGYEPTAVFDPLGGEFTGGALGAMGAHGRLVIFGSSANGTGSVPLQAIYRKGLKVLGYAGLLESDDALDAAKGKALEALADGRLKVTIDSEFPLVDTNDALERLNERSSQGEVVLSLAG